MTGSSTVAVSGDVAGSGNVAGSSNVAVPLRQRSVFATLLSQQFRVRRSQGPSLV